MADLSDLDEAADTLTREHGVEYGAYRDQLLRSYPDDPASVCEALTAFIWQKYEQEAASALRGALIQPKTMFP